MIFVIITQAAALTKKANNRIIPIVRAVFYANIAFILFLEATFMNWKDRMPSNVRDVFFKEYASAREYRHVAVDCSLGTNPLGAPERVLARLASIGNKVDISSYPTGDELFRKVLSAAWGGAFQPEEVILGTGSIGLLITLARTFCGPDATVVGLTPQFPDGPLHFRLTGATCKSIPLKGPDFAVSLEAVASELSGKESLVYIDRPHNPTGQASSLVEIETIADSCARNGSLLVVDEAYGDFLPQEESAIHLPRENIITLRSFSKGWGLAGIRAGYAVIKNREAREFIAKVAPPFSVNSIAMEVATAAMEETSFLAMAREAVEGIKKSVLELVNRTPRVSASKTHPAVPIVLITHKDPSVDLYELLMSQGIRTESGACYDGLDSSSVRLRVPSPKELPLFMELWEKALGNA
jgi:histidinol-phosphate aminotransferase